MRHFFAFLRDWLLAVLTSFAALLSEPLVWIILLVCLLVKCC